MMSSSDESCSDYYEYSDTEDGPTDTSKDNTPDAVMLLWKDMVDTLEADEVQETMARVFQEVEESTCTPPSPPCFP